MGNGNVNVYERLFKLWSKVSKFVIDGTRDQQMVVNALQEIITFPPYLIYAGCISSDLYFLRLLDLIAGGEQREITTEQFREHRDLMMYLMLRMRFRWDQVPESDNARQYYHKMCWQFLDRPDMDDTKLLHQINSLRDTIRMK